MASLELPSYHRVRPLPRGGSPPRRSLLEARGRPWSNLVRGLSVLAAGLTGWLFSLAHWDRVAPFGYAWYVASFLTAPFAARTASGPALPGRAREETLLPAMALVGASLGHLRMGGAFMIATLLAGSAIWFGRNLPLFRRRGEQPGGRTEARMVVMSGVASFLLVLSHGAVAAARGSLAFAAPLLAISGSLAFSGTLLLRPVWRVLWYRKNGFYPARLDRSEQAGFLLVAALAVSASAQLGLELGPVRISLVLAFGTSLLAAAAGGAGAATAAAAALGLAESAVSHQAASVVICTTGALFAGLFPARRRMGIVAWYAMGMAAAATALLAGEGMNLGDEVFPMAYAASFLVAALAFVAGPAFWVEWVRLLFQPRDDATSDEVEAFHLRHQMTARLIGVREVLEQVAAVFEQAPAGSPAGVPVDLSRLLRNPVAGMALFLREVDEDCCRGCPARRSCWQEKSQETYWALVDLLASGERGEQVRFEDMPLSLRRRCLRARRLVAAINRFLRVSRLLAHWRRKVWESRRLVGGELRGLAQLMEVLAAEMQAEVQVNSGLSARLEAELLGRGFPPARVTVLMLGAGEADSNRYQIDIGLWLARREEAEGWAERLAEVTSRAVGRRLDGELLRVTPSPFPAPAAAAAGLPPPFPPAGSGCLPFRADYRLLPAQEFRVRWGVAATAKTGAAISGDAVIRFPLGDEQEVIALIDGMGSGSPAADESQTAMEMLRRLLIAGFSPEFAVRTLNAALLLRSEERFAALDLVTLDLHRGMAELIKIGSPPSFLVRRNKISTVSSSTLPVGILAGIPVEPQRLRLLPGDLLVLCTDGVLEAGAHTGQEVATVTDWITRALAGGVREPRRLADELFSAALSSAGGEFPDDTTVVVIMLEEGRSSRSNGTPPGWGTEAREYVRLPAQVLPPIGSEGKDGLESQISII